MVLEEEQPPLDPPILLKTSGLWPPRTSDFYQNEWGMTHSKQRFFHKRVGTNPLEQTVLYKTSGSKQAQQASLSPAVQPKSSGIAQNQEQ